MKSKLFTAINLIGLTAGLTVSFFLLIFIINELTFNTFHTNSDRICRIIMHSGGAAIPGVPSRLATRLQERETGIIQTGGLVYIPLSLGPVIVEKEPHSREEPGFFCADPALLDILTFTIVSGEGKSGLEKPGSVMLSRSMAETYFGQGDPIGQTLQIKNYGTTVTLTVTGVFEKLPWNSTVRIDFLAGMDLFHYLMEQIGTDIHAEAERYADMYAESYLLLDNRNRVREIETLLPSLVDSLGITQEGGYFSLQNIEDIQIGRAHV